MVDWLHNGEVGNGIGLGGFRVGGGVQPWAWVNHMVLAIGGLETSPAKDVRVGLAAV